MLQNNKQMCPTASEDNWLNLSETECTKLARGCNDRINKMCGDIIVWIIRDRLFKGRKIIIFFIIHSLIP